MVWDFKAPSGLKIKRPSIGETVFKPLGNAAGGALNVLFGATDLAGTAVTGAALVGADVVTEAGSAALYFTEGVGESFGTDLGLETTADKLSGAVTYDGLGEQLSLDVDNLVGAGKQAAGGVQSIWDLEAGTALSERGRAEQAEVREKEAAGAGLTGAAGLLDDVVDFLIPTGGVLKFGGRVLTNAGKARLGNMVIYQKIAGMAKKYRKTTIASVLTSVGLAAAETLEDVTASLEAKGATTRLPPDAEIVEQGTPILDEMPEQTREWTTAEVVSLWEANARAAAEYEAENQRLIEESRAKEEAEAAAREAALADMLAQNELENRLRNEAAEADAKARREAAAQERTDLLTLKSNLLTMARPIVESKVSEVFNQLIDTEKEKAGLGVGAIPTVLTVVDGVMGQLMSSSPDQISQESFVADLATQSAMFYIDRFARDYAGVEWNEKEQRFVRS